MDEKYVLTAFIYLFITTGIIGLLPNDIVNGVDTATLPDGSGIKEVTSIPERIWNMVAFLLIPITITGIPLFFGILLQLINILCIFVTAVWVKVTFF